jgi:excisionase family DNA binding protein
MARKFVTLAEAAQQLGITPDEVNELRQRGDLYGYRDGTSWKFKPEDVDRVAEQRIVAPAANDESQEVILLGDSQEISDAPMDLPIDPDVEEDSGEDVVLLSEFELGESGASASKTVIGRPGEPLSSLDSDVKLVSAGDPDGASGTLLGVPGLPQGPGESAVRLGGKEVDDPSASVTIIGTPGQPVGPEESTVRVEATRPDDPGTSATMIGAPGLELAPDESAVKLQAVEIEPPSSTVIGRPGQPMGPGESEVKLSAFEDSSFDLDTIKSAPRAAAPAAPPVAAPSSVRLDAPHAADPVVDSGITLGEESSEDDFVLSGPGSDITISPGDSGISLVDPGDSGLSLDAPIELRSAAAEAGLAGAESGDLGAATEFDSDEVMELKTSDEFLLTPMTAEGEESEDSGSQVIALDSESSPFESSEGSMFAESGASMSTMLEEDVGGAAQPLAEGGLAPAASSAAFAATAGAAPAMAAAETPYPVWVVLLMGTCTVFLALCGMMMYDLVRNMWSWNEPYKVNSAIMDAIMGLFG